MINKNPHTRKVLFLNNEDEKDVDVFVSDLLKKKSKLRVLDFIESGGLRVEVEHIDKKSRTILFSISRTIGWIKHNYSSQSLRGKK